MIVLAAPAAGSCAPRGPSDALPRVQANDNRVPGGSLIRDTLAIRLVVKLAEWRPEADSGPPISVAAFAEEGRAPQIPAPLIRVRQGAMIAATVRNALPDLTIGVIGLVTHPALRHDTVFIKPGETREVRFAAGMPGTYLHRAILGTHSRDDTLHEREQMARAFVVEGADGSTSDRVFVINICGEQ